MKHRYNGIMADVMFLAICVLAILGSPPLSHAESALPTPSITPSAFVMEPRGVSPRDGDQRIPNPATPTGTPIASVSCTETFIAGPHVTAESVNTAIAHVENRMTQPATFCLSGTFNAPVHVWGKYTSALLTIAPLPGRAASLVLGVVRSSAVNNNEYDGVAGAVSIVDSRSVEIRGLTIKGYHTQGTAETPAGIYVEERAAGFGGTPSACFVHGDRACSNIYVIDNHISHIANLADTVDTSKSWCNNGNVDAFGIEIESFGKGNAEALQHVVVEGNTISDTRTGQSETLAVNGDVKDFLIADNRIYNNDNIGIDTEGWYNGTGQARFGIVKDNVVANIDTWNNHAYGQWNPVAHTCNALPPNAAGIYDDGGSYIWIANNVVANTDQGISLDTENAKKWTDHILVSGNHVWNSPGTRLGDPSFGTNPPGIPGRSTVSGHAYDAFYVDAFGAQSRIYDVYAYNNVFQNASQYFGGTEPQSADVVDFGGQWRNVVLWNNTIAGGGRQDHQVVLLGIDNRPLAASGTAIDCTDYQRLSRGANFSFRDSYHTLAAWQRHNPYHWDAQSRVNQSPGCPALTHR